MKRFYYMAGLPRAGSTLLCSLLNQNPKFYATPSSPTPGVMLSAIQGFTGNELFYAYERPDAAKNVVSKLMPNFYEDIEAEVIIEKNRSWTNNIEILKWYVDPEPKIICPVRGIDEILASFLAMIHRNPLKPTDDTLNFIDQALVMKGQKLTDTNRCMHLISDAGVLGQAYVGLKDAFENHRKNIHFVEYNDLVANPALELARIYDFIGEPTYQHTFDDISNATQEADGSNYGLADMHEVRSVVEHRPDRVKPEDIVPEEILKSIQGEEFWR